MGKINKDNIVDRAKALSKQTLGVRAVKGVLAVTEMHAHSKSKEKIIEKLKKAFESQRLSWLTAKKVLDDRVQDNLNNDQLKALSDFISKMQAMNQREYEIRLRSGQLREAYKENVELFNQALTEMAPYFTSVADYEELGANAISEMWAELDKSAIVGDRLTPSAEDLDLVNAFRILGTELSWTGAKWQLDGIATKNSAFGMTEENFKFSEPEVKSLIDNYLNVVPAQRNGRITPEGLFKVYEERAKQKINGWKLNEVEEDTLMSELDKFSLTLDTSGHMWEMALLTDPNVIRLNAEKIAYMELSQELQGELPKLGDSPKVSSDIKSKLNANAVYGKDGDARDLIGRLEKACKPSLNKISNAKDFSLLENIEKLYDDKLEQITSALLTMESKGVPADDAKMIRVHKQLQAMEQARDSLHANVALIKFNVMSHGNEQELPKNAESLRGKFASSIRASSVQFEGDKFMVVNNNGEEIDVTAELIEVIKNRLASKQQSQQSFVDDFKNKLANKYGAPTQQPAQSETEQEESYLPDITEFAFDFEENGFAWRGAIDEMFKLSLAERLFAKGEPLDLQFEEYKKNNPGKSIQDFAQEKYGEENPLIPDAQSIVAGYVRACNHRGEITQPSPQTIQYINATNEAFGRNVIILDRAMKSFSEEEIKKYNDPTMPADAKRAMVRDKINQAIAKGNINPHPGNKEYVEAMKTHKNDLMMQKLQANIPVTKAIEAENGANPMLSKALDKYLQEVAEGHSKDIEELNEEEQVELTQEQPKPKKYKYKDKSKASTDPGLLKKAMKGLSMEECVKKFLKPLLKDLQDIVIIEQPKDPKVVAQEAAEAKAREEEARKKAEELKRQQEEERAKQKAEQEAQRKKELDYVIDGIAKAVNGNNTQSQAEGVTAQSQNGGQVQQGGNASNAQTQEGTPVQIVQGTPVQVVQEGASAQPTVTGVQHEQGYQTINVGMTRGQSQSAPQSNASVSSQMPNGAQQTVEGQTTPKIDKRQFEASSFIPGWAIIMDALDNKREALSEIDSSKGKPTKLIQARDRMENLSKVFEVLSSVDDNPNYPKDESGRDFGDKCRKIAIGICTGAIKDRATVQQELESAMNGCNLSEERKGKLKSGFELLSPELMLYMMEFSSDMNYGTEKNAEGKKECQVKIGTKLPMKGIQQCSNDKERKDYIRKFVKQNLKNRDVGVEMLEMLVEDYAKEITQSANSNIGYQSDVAILDDEEMDML